MGTFYTDPRVGRRRLGARRPRVARGDFRKPSRESGHVREKRASTGNKTGDVGVARIMLVLGGLSC
jgi:hypothetical protein